MPSSRAAVVVFLSACLAMPALAGAQGGYQTDPTREQWVAQADDICKRPYKRAAKQLRRLRPLTKRGKYPKAGRVLIGVAETVLDVNGQVAELARPPADEDAIAAYLKGERRGAKFAKASGQALKQVKVRRAIKLLKRADRAENKGQKHVRGFGLRHCI